MGLFGGGGWLEKAWGGIEHAASEAWKATEQGVSHLNEVTFGSMNEKDWRTVGLTAAGIALGAVTGGLGWGLAAGAGTAAMIGAGILGGAAGGVLGYQQGESIAATQRAEESQRYEKAKADAQMVQNEIQAKQSLLAAAQNMTAREAMARNINAAIKNMYSARMSRGGGVQAETLGGDETKLGG